MAIPARNSAFPPGDFDRRGAVQEAARLLERDEPVDQAVLEHLEPADRPIECGALLRVRARELERATRDTEQRGRRVEPLTVEGREHGAETGVDAPEHVRLGHVHVGERQDARREPAEPESLDRADAQAGRVARHDERRDAVEW